jgi:hypothetical protein
MDNLKEKLINSIKEEEIELKINTASELVNYASAMLDKGNYISYEGITDQFRKSNIINSNLLIRIIKEFRLMIKFIESDIEYLKKSQFLFDFYIELSYIMSKYKFNDKEIYNIIKYVVGKNEELGISEAEKILRAEKIYKHKFQTISKEELEDIINNRKLSEFLKRDEFVDENRLKQQKEFVENIEEFFVDNTVGKYNKKIYHILFEKEKTFSSANIKMVSIYLKQLGVSSEITDKLARYMERMLQKRLKETNNNIDTSKEKYIYASKDKKEYITDAEYKNLKKELKEYYDPYKMIIKKEMDDDKVLEIAKIMYKLGYEDDEIRRIFLLKDENNNIDKTNAISTFVKYYEKLKYYYSLEELKPCTEILEEMCICSDSDYIIWKKLFEDEFKKKEEIISSQYDYEIKKIKQK